MIHENPLTNFQTVRKSVERLTELEKWEAEGVLKAISKKESSRLTKEMNRLKKLLGGIRDMRTLPNILFVIDPMDTQGAVREAKTLGITVVGVCDTNCDPDNIDVPIPGNDDAARSIKLFCAAIADSIIEGRNEANGVTTENAEAAAPAEEQVEEKEVENPVLAEAFKKAIGSDITEEALEEEEELEPEVKAHGREEKKAKKEALAAKAAKK